VRLAYLLAVLFSLELVEELLSAPAFSVELLSGLAEAALSVELSLFEPLPDLPERP
jgi:hypothetical protein